MKSYTLVLYLPYSNSWPFMHRQKKRVGASRTRLTSLVKSVLKGTADTCKILLFTSRKPAQKSVRLQTSDRQKKKSRHHFTDFRSGVWFEEWGVPHPERRVPTKIMRLFQIAALAALAGVTLVTADDEHGENAVELKEKGFEVRYLFTVTFTLLFDWC